MIALEAQPIIVWFRNDLRLRDHPALNAASKSGAPLLALFVLDHETPGIWRRGAASRWWLHHSLSAHAECLRAAGLHLVLRSGQTREVIAEFAAETNAAAVYATRIHEPWSEKLDREVLETLRVDGRDFKRFAGQLLHDPDHLKTKTGGPYKVYTPFWRALSSIAIRPPVKPPKKLLAHDPVPRSEILDTWQLRPEAPDWAGGFRSTWSGNEAGAPGEAGAQRQFRSFLKHRISTYHEARDRPGVLGTSRLSPHLHFGEISPAECWHAVRAAIVAGTTDAVGAEMFLKEIVWREFSYHLLHHFPDLPNQAFRGAFNQFPWADVPANLKAWQRGLTGYPIVDAGMRELWHTGWMHNRVRMIVASFLTKHLRIDWREGENWFWDCLVDADLASNSASWQWVAGSGADAAPYFRIFNPITQGEKFDAEGDYVRRWVPEIAALPDKYLHQPWTAPDKLLQDNSITLGTTYPTPIVDHREARTAALAAYEKIKAGR